MERPRLVTRLPLEHLWDEDGAAFGRRLRALDPEDVRGLLRGGPFRFVEATIGRPLRWVPPSGCFARWRAVAPNVARADAVRLDEYPGGSAWFASEWLGRQSERLVVLEERH